MTVTHNPLHRSQRAEALVAGPAAVALENLALRYQRQVIHSTHPHPRLYRLIWIAARETLAVGSGL
jgi:hypothetical protein